MVKLPHRRQFLHLAAGAAALPAVSRIAGAQTYPTHPIRFVVPAAAGGGIDFVARLIGEHVSSTIGQPVLIENKGGAGGMLGVEMAAKSPPDGYTVLICNDSLASAPHTVRFNVDYVWTLLPVIQTVLTAQVIVVNPSLDVHSLPELIATAKHQPGIAYATSGVGSQQHFLMEWIARDAGIKLEHVPYRGAGQAVNDFIAGHIMIAALGPVAMLPHHQAGTLRIIAQSGRKRAPILPDVSTVEEAGLKGIVIETWQGAFVPKGTPSTIISRLNAEIQKAIQDPTVGQKLREATYELVGGSPEQLAALVRGDSEKYERLARELNIKVD
jgi:tripartite-type tricarboxylate transporter receptor subunit TctC